MRWPGSASATASRYRNHFVGSQLAGFRSKVLASGAYTSNQNHLTCGYWLWHWQCMCFLFLILILIKVGYSPPKKERKKERTLSLLEKLTWGSNAYTTVSGRVLFEKHTWPWHDCTAHSQKDETGNIRWNGNWDSEMSSKVSLEMVHLNISLNLDWVCVCVRVLVCVLGLCL